MIVFLSGRWSLCRPCQLDTGNFCRRKLENVLLCGQFLTVFKNVESFWSPSSARHTARRALLCSWKKFELSIRTLLSSNVIYECSPAYLRIVYISRLFSSILAARFRKLWNHQDDHRHYREPAVKNAVLPVSGAMPFTRLNCQRKC